MIDQTISHYRIVEELGSGSMGTVYKALDTKLDRFVALKFLPPHLSQAEEEKKRFIHEAKTASALDHPNICNIHEIDETADGQIFIVMACYKGESLKVKIDRGSLQIEETLDIAIQIARGLEKAHANDIIHRDIKPANVLITEDGQVKIIDFGLAKLRSCTILTKAGTSLGTIAYMSPEQTKGVKVDHRTDIWALGVILYEMLSGERPFKGDYEQAVIYSILNDEVKLDNIKHAGISAIVKKCLAKDKTNRYQSAVDLLKDLGIEKKLLGETSRTAKIETKNSGSAVYRIIGALFVLFLLVIYFLFFGPEKEIENLPPMKTTRLTSYQGEEYFPTLSPDGKSVAFSWNGPQQDNFDIYVKLVCAGKPVRLTTNTLADIRPEWSHDGSYIAFVREVEFRPQAFTSEIYIIPSLGGREQKITGFIVGRQERPSISWSYDNKFIYYSSWSGKDVGCVIYKISIETNEREQITTLPKDTWGDLSPRISPDGKYVAFLRGQYNTLDIFVKNLENNKVQRITHINTWIDGFSWGKDNRSILFACNLDGISALWKAGFSDEKLKKITSGINISDPYLSVQGDRLVYSETIENSNIWKIDLQNPDRETLLIGSSTFNNIVPNISPDEKKILFISNRTGTYNVWVCDINGANQYQLTFLENQMRAGGAKWSPSGLEILISFSDGLYILNASGGIPIKIRSESLFASWNKDGSGFYSHQSDQKGRPNIYSFTKDGKIQKQITHERGLHPYLFEDYIYYIKSWNYHNIWRIPIDSGVEEPVLEGITDLDVSSLAVVKNGIYFIRENMGSPVLEFYNFSTKKISHVKDVPLAYEMSLRIEIDHDETYLLYSKREPNKSDIVLVENFRIE